MPKYNLPNSDDPDFADKLIDLLRDLFNSNESDVKDFKPIDSPTEGLQIGSVWFDKTDGKLKVNTEDGVKTVQFEP